MMDKKEFDDALQIIAAYHLQLEKSQTTNLREIKGRKINIQKELKPSVFKVLQHYYLEEYKIELKMQDLCAMDVRLLSKIKYEKLESYKGIGKIALFHFKKLLISHSVFVPLK
jgi:hypothetical protein